MIFPDTTTECPHCGKKKLLWMSQIKTRVRDRQIDESTFRCDLCQREYTYSDRKLSEKKKERDQVAETVAIQNSELEIALKRRCTVCGGLVTSGDGIYALHCAWCFQEYSMISGELRPKLPEKTPRRLETDSFYAV